MLLFRSGEHLDRWIETGHERGSTMTVEQQWELAHTWYRDRDRPEWVRRTPEKAQQVFERVGLTGDFWRLQA
jgi:hypothetical protein